MCEKKLIIGICGASGVFYAVRLLKALLEKPYHIYLVISNSGYSVLRHELQYDGKDIVQFLRINLITIFDKANLSVCGIDDFYAPPASGSFKHDGMIICPCSMKTLGAIANGITDNLLTRSADVTLKEKRPLILLPRETPLHLVHLKNMEILFQTGATIMPLAPPFYNSPESVTQLVDTMIGRILDQLNINHTLCPEWQAFY